MAHPYKTLPDRNFWSRAVAGQPPFLLDPGVEPPFRIGPNDKVATAGSCFAQNIARRLANSGFNYFVTEPAPQEMPHAEASERNFGVYSSRYGNVYTTRQLLQLIQRAYDPDAFDIPVWKLGDRFADPFRPQIEPWGFESEAILQASRAEHLAAVRRMFEELDILVFTLGLTECWRHLETGAIVPIAPGVAGGEWDPGVYGFHNQTVAEVITDLTAFLELLRSVNPRSKVLLTVSPVPLAATYEQRHVMTSTVYSKSVLRVAADEIERAFSDVAYFPSYEIITASSNGQYYDTDLRNVRTIGVDHVMRVFFDHMVERGEPGQPRVEAGFVRMEAREAASVVCDEEAIERAM